jgi:hypothetical protein
MRCMMSPECRQRTEPGGGHFEVIIWAPFVHISRHYLALSLSLISFWDESLQQQCSVLGDDELIT